MCATHKKQQFNCETKSLLSLQSPRSQKPPINAKKLWSLQDTEKKENIKNKLAKMMSFLVLVLTKGRVFGGVGAML